MSNIAEFADIPEYSVTGNLTLQDVSNLVTEIYTRNYKAVNGTAPPLNKADPIMLTLKSMTELYYMMIQIAEKRTRCALLKTATGAELDNMGLPFGVKRTPATYATVTVRFTLSAVQKTVAMIPQGTRVRTAAGVYFATMDYAQIDIGKTYVDVLAQAEVVGAGGNDIPPGVVDTLVDAIPYVAAVENTDTSSGGADVESDDSPSPDAMIILETRLDFSKYVPGGFGTGDCVIIAEPILDVIDFKYGKGHRVEAEDNPQMQLYGLGALEQFGDLYEIKTVRMTIFQPRLSGIEDSSEKTVKELTSWGKSYVKPRAKLADKGEGDFAPSEEACRFCRAKNQCRARAEENLKLFDESPDPLLISPEEAGAILAKSADIETWLKDLRELVSGALTAGETVTGWKMVEGRSNRKFADEDKVVAAMKAAGYDESLLYDRKLITLTQMERDFGKKTLAEVLGDLIVKPQGAPTLAPESDKRPAYRFEDQVLKAFDE